MRTRFSTFLAIAVAFALVVSAFALTGCGKKQDITGEWRIQGSPMIVVITESEFKMPGGASFGYAIDFGAGTITLGLGQDNEASAPFTLSEDGALLTITETAEDGTQTATILEKISDNVDAEARVEGMGSSTEETTTE